MENVLPRAFGKYLLERRLGVGGMAETFVARREGFGGIRQHVCLKRVLPAFNGDQSFRIQFQREAKLAARLRHTNIVATIDHGDVDDVQYMVLELVEGIDVRALLGFTPEKRLPVEQVLLIAFDIAHALEYAHEPQDGRDGIVHRDVTPSNILLSTDGAVKLADFGVAKSLGTTTAMTATGVMKGKMPYMPPEQMKGGEIDGRVDLFSLGVLMYEALAGRRPFVGAHDVEVMTRIVSGDRPGLGELMPHLDVAIVEIVEDLLEIEPADRTSTATHLIDRLAPLVPPPKFRRELAERVRAAYGEDRHEGEASDTVLAEAGDLPKPQGDTPDAFAPTIVKSSPEISTAKGKHLQQGRSIVPRTQDERSLHDGSPLEPVVVERAEPAILLGDAPGENSETRPLASEVALDKPAREERPRAFETEVSTTIDQAPVHTRGDGQRVVFLVFAAAVVVGIGAWAFWPTTSSTVAVQTPPPSVGASVSLTVSGEPTRAEVDMGELPVMPDVPELSETTSTRAEVRNAEPQNSTDAAEDTVAPENSDSEVTAAASQMESEVSSMGDADGEAESSAPESPTETSEVSSTKIAMRERVQRARGRVTVAPWGDVWVDGRYMGRAPRVLALEEGTHIIAVGRERPLVRRRVRVGPERRRFRVHVDLDATLSMQ